MFWWDKSQVEERLAALGAIRLGEDSWQFEDEITTTNDMIHSAVDDLFTNRPWTEADVHLALGLVDQFDDYATIIYFPFSEYLGNESPFEDQVIAFCREVLGRVGEWRSVLTWVAVVAFEGDESADWFIRLIGDTSTDALDDEENIRRISRVLMASQSVPWPVKSPIFECLVTQPALHPALFDALRFAYSARPGSMELPAGLALLQRLDLPAETEYLVEVDALFRQGLPSRIRDA